MLSRIYHTVYLLSRPVAVMGERYSHRQTGTWHITFSFGNLLRCYEQVPRHLFRGHNRKIVRKGKGKKVKNENENNNKWYQLRAGNLVYIVERVKKNREAVALKEIQGVCGCFRNLKLGVTCRSSKEWLPSYQRAQRGGLIIQDSRRDSFLRVIAIVVIILLRRRNNPNV